MSNEWGTAGLVPGLKIKMTSKELASHLQARSDCHAQRRNEKQEYLPQLEDAAAKLKAQHPAQTVQAFSKSGLTSGGYQFDGDGAVEQLKADIKSHNNKSVAFKFLAEHLFEQDYCLDREDLVRLEILKS